MPVLNTSQLITSGCPSKTGPSADPDGSKTLVHVVDAAGNDFKIRCIKGLIGFHYEYSVSFPNGTSEVISTCIYDLGLNDAEVVYTGAMALTNGPTGTPIYTVGSIQVAEHSNTEGTGNALSGITPKPGGSDFHMVYDYRQKFRYRLNTIVSKPPHSTDYFSARTWSPEHSIARAEAQAMLSPADFVSALATDMAFRLLDDPDAVDPPTDCAGQEPDPDSRPIGYVWLGREAKGGAILFDPLLRGTGFRFGALGIEGMVPPVWGRERATISLQRTLLAGHSSELAVYVDGAPRRSVARDTESMVTLEFALNWAAHHVLFAEARTIPY